MNKKLIILGSGGYGETVADVVTQLGYKITIPFQSIPFLPLSTIFFLLLASSLLLGTMLSA